MTRFITKNKHHIPINDRVKKIDDEIQFMEDEIKRINNDPKRFSLSERQGIDVMDRGRMEIRELKEKKEDILQLDKDKHDIDQILDFLKRKPDSTEDNFSESLDVPEDDLPRLLHLLEKNGVITKNNKGKINEEFPKFNIKKNVRDMTPIEFHSHLQDKVGTF